MKTIKHERLHLQNGRRVILDTCELTPGKFETMLLLESSGEEIDSAIASTEEQALLDFDRIKAKHMASELSGKYAALAEALKAAKAAGKLSAESLGDDGGTCNMDAPAVVLPRFQRSKVEAAAQAAGVGCFHWREMGPCYVFPLRLGYQGFANTAAAESAAASLKAAGHETLVYYQMD